MNSPDLGLNPHLEAALQRIRTAAEQASERCAEGMGLAALSAGQAKRRDLLLATQLVFRRQQGLFSQRFTQELRQQLSQEQAPKAEATTAAKKDWTELSLMDDDAVDALVVSDRIGLAIGHQSEWELREVESYVASLRNGDRNPLRPELVARALLAAVHAVTEDSESRQILVDEMTRAMTQEMRACYADIAELFRHRGLRPQDLRVRGSESPNASTRTQGLAGGASVHSELDSGPGGQAQFNHSGPRSARSEFGNSYSGSSYGGAGMAGGHSRYGSANAGGMGVVDGQLMDLLRRLAQAPAPAGVSGFGGMSGMSGGLPSGAVGGHAGSAALGPAALGAAPGDWAEDFGGSAWQGVQPPNLIQIHRDELRQAATGRLDHMVIDVVSSLFDQVLSDPKVPPQMARLLARLQLPVLRAALGDPSFFSSRRHPVRRFVNRMASLACAFDDFSETPGSDFLAHVRDLVQEVASGDFDRMEVYESKLDALERFIQEQIAGTLKSASEGSAVGDMAELLDRKEIDLRLQQRYTQQLQTALAPVPMQDFLRDFLAQVWSQAIVLSSRDPKGTPERTLRFRQLGRELVMSVQPKGGTAQRQAFLSQLPALMRTLGEGLDLIAWPEPARKVFFGALLPAHAESLKGVAPSALETNLLIKQLDGVFGCAPPEERDLPADAPVTVPQDLDMGSRLSPQEAQSLGLVRESGVDWDGTVDIVLGDDEPQAPLQAVDISIDGLPAATEAPEPSEGELLIDHLQPGFAYRMHTGDSWHKVRLAHISAGRSFFIFTQGAKHQETVTMTARMLKRLCESGRLRAFEHAYLMERAISRARKQLAAIGSKS